MYNYKYIIINNYITLLILFLSSYSYVSVIDSLYMKNIFDEHNCFTYMITLMINIFAYS